MTNRTEILKFLPLYSKKGYREKKYSNSHLFLRHCSLSSHLVEIVAHLVHLVLTLQLGPLDRLGGAN